MGGDKGEESNQVGKRIGSLIVKASWGQLSV